MGPISLSLPKCDKRTLWQWLSPFSFFSVSLSLLYLSLVCSRSCLSLCAYQWSHYHCCSYCCRRFGSVVILLMLLLVVVWLLLQVMCKSGFFSWHKMKCNVTWTGYFSCTNLLVTISFYICIFGNKNSCHFHLVCYLCIVHVVFHSIVSCNGFLLITTISRRVLKSSLSS
jgi:hypothetical protein